jgi:lipid A disaccharide synthetase
MSIFAWHMPLFDFLYWGKYQYGNFFNQSSPLLRMLLFMIALFGISVISYYLIEKKLSALLKKLFEKILNVKYVSLVNLIANREVVKELLACYFTPENTRKELENILQPTCREKIMQGYELMRSRLGAVGAPRHAAKVIVKRVVSC